MTSPTRATRRQLETPDDRMAPPALPLASAMKGVILTETGEPLATPTPGTKLVDIFVETPRIGNNSLGFAKIFDFDKEDEEELSPPQEEVGVTETTPTRMSPSKRRPDAARTKKGTEGSAPRQISTRADSVQRSPSKRKSVGASTNTQLQATVAPVPSRTAPAPPARRPSRLRRPSISSRSHAKRAEAAATDTPDLNATITSAVPPSTSSSSSASSSSSSSSSSSGSAGTVTSDDTTRCAPPATPKYDLEDEENLPSPFLRRFERERGGGGTVFAMGMEVVSRGAGASSGGTATVTRLKRPSGANLLRVAAAANSAKAAGSVAVGGKGNTATATGTMTRTSARKAREEARNALLRM